MPILRTVKCDMCSKIEIEEAYGAGWPGWCIIQGISVRNPTEDAPIQPSDMTIYLCDFHKNRVACFIEEELKDIDLGD